MYVPYKHMKATIIEQLVIDHNLSFKDCEKGVCVTRRQLNRAQLGFAKNVKEETVEKFEGFCLGHDYIQDAAYGSGYFRRMMAHRSSVQITL